jgi:putative two-component system response regulator
MCPMAKILVIENTSRSLVELNKILTRNKYSVVSSEDRESALKLLDGSSVELIFVSDNLPGSGSLELCKEIRKKIPIKKLPIIFLFSDLPSYKNIREAFLAGGSDYLVKPVEELTLIRLMNYYLLTRTGEAERERAYQALKSAHEELGDYYGEDDFTKILQVLENKDSYSRGHSMRVAHYAVEMGKRLSISNKQLKMLRIGGMMHDIGKLGISRKILTKPGSLTDEEYDVIKTHPMIAEHIMNPLKAYREAREIVYLHHERVDGRGYYSVLGDEVSFLSRIVTVADAFDAMTTTRSYRLAMSFHDAFQELELNTGTQFDRTSVNVLRQMMLRKICVIERDDNAMVG